MIYTDRDDAKDFFITRIAEEAKMLGQRLSELEVKMLKWTESSPIRDLKEDELPALQQVFSSQYDDSEFEPAHHRYIEIRLRQEWCSA